MKARAAAAAALVVVALGTGKGAAADQIAPARDSIQPGQWEVVMQVTSVDMPGAPPEARARVRAMPGQAPQTDRRCITPEQAANPARNLFGSGSPSPSCQFSDRTFADGVVRIRGACSQPGRDVGQAELAVDGDFTATNVEARLTVSAVAPNMSGGSGTQTLRVNSILRGRRLGDCPPAPPAPAPAPEN